MIKSIALLGSLLCALISVNAQNNPGITNFKNQTNIFPPSPNAAALAKYAEIPMNTHTGIPQISVPFYQWKSKKGNAAINVGLSYHAGGIKVEDVSSNVGTGWALNAGGVITRSVRGKPDDAGTGYINTPIIADFNTTVYAGGHYMPFPATAQEYITMDTSRNHIIAWFNNPAGDDNVMHSLFTGHWDTEQDLFYYNIGGLSGKFVLDKDGSVNKIDDNALEITVQYGLLGPYNAKYIQSFTIQSDDGIKYLFNVIEYSGINSVSGTTGYTNATTGPPTYHIQNTQTGSSSAFYVSRAVDMNSKDTVFYDYFPRTISYDGGFSESQEYHENNEPYLLSQGFYTINKISSRTDAYINFSNETWSLQNIRSNDGTSIKFYYDNARLDLNGDSALTRIEISDITGASKKFRLNYSYFDSRSTVAYPLTLGSLIVFSSGESLPYDYGHTNPYFYNRLKLDNILQVTAWENAASIELYAFEYNDTILPPRSSKAIDFWGYYYGPKRYAYTLIPQVYPSIVENPQVEGLQSTSLDATILNAFTDGADRVPDELYARASTLKKIHLPTGGHTSFHFETNSVKDPIYPYSNTKYMSENHGRSPITLISNLPFNSRSSEQVMFYIYFKRVNANGTTYIPPIDNGGPYSCLGEGGAAYNITFHVESTDATVSKQCSFTGVDDGSGLAKVYFSLPLNKTYNCYFSFANSGDPCFTDIHFNLTVNTKYTITNTNNLVGGLRVANIRHFDPVSSSILTSVYNYNADDGHTSGIIPIIPNYNYHVRSLGQWSCCGEECTGTYPVFLGHAMYKIRTSSSTQTLGYAFGSNAGYTKVSTIKVNAQNQSLGKIVEMFTGSVMRNFHDVHPYKTNQLLDWKSGHKWQDAIYDNANNLQKRTSYGYSDLEYHYNTAKNRSIRMSCLTTDACYEKLHNPEFSERLVSNAFYPYHGRSFLTSKREAQFSGSDSIVTTTTYGYQSDGYLAGTNILDNSKGLKTSNHFHYPAEYTHAAMQQLVTNKVKSTAVASRTYQSLFSLTNPIDNEIQGEGVDYGIYNGFARPQFFSKLSSSNAAVLSTFDAGNVKTNLDETVGEVMLYDSYGNVVEFKGRDGITVAIIWAYKRNIPIAKIVGATYADAVSKLTSISYDNLQLLTDENTLRAKINEIRQAYSSNPLVQVTGSTSKPLIGTTSETDPNGKTIYYEYDAFGRLKLIRDKDNKILKTFDYQYKANP